MMWQGMPKHWHTSLVVRDVLDIEGLEQPSDLGGCGMEKHKVFMSDLKLTVYLIDNEH